MAGKSKRLLRLAVATAVVALLAYYVYFAGNNQPVLLQQLAAGYSFSDLWNAAILLLGKSTVVVLATGFIALAAFFTSIPASGGFSSLHARVAGLFLLNQVITWLT